MIRSGLARLLARGRRRDILERATCPALAAAGPLLRRSDQTVPICPPGSLFREKSTEGPAAAVSQNIYLHHTDVGSAVNSAGLTIGLINALQVLHPGTGYFRPIDRTSHGGQRAELIREVFKLDTPVEDMMGISQEKAVELIRADQLDDLIELILPAYERLKRHHDFVVIEGTSLKDGTNTTPLNALLASTLGCPTLLLNDADAAMRHKADWKERLDFEELDWESEAVGSVLDHERIMRNARVDVAGAMFYRVPKVSRGITRLQEGLQGTGVAFLGAIPEDSQLEALQLEDVKKLLDAEVLYGGEGEAEGALTGVDINKILVATLHLEDFLSHIPTSEDPSQGALVVAHASRPDVLLGCIALHETTLPTQVAGVLLTGGSHPPVDIDTVIRSRPQGCSLPVLISPMDTAGTVISLANCKGELHPTSLRKIERAQTLFNDSVDLETLNSVLFKERPMTMNPKMFQHNIFSKAKEIQQHIVLPEGEEPRTIQAAGALHRQGLCRLTLLGDPAKIVAQAKTQRVDLSGIDIINPNTAEKLEEYAELVHRLRKHKGITLEHALFLLTGDVNYFGTAMIAAGDADGMVSGAIHTTANTVRPALQIIKTLPGVPIVSSVFFMCLPDKVLVYGDCAVNENPTPEELATIAISSADTAKAFGIDPRVAMLSYATGDSNSGPIVQKVADATAIAKERRPDLAIEGPLQYDAAVNPEIAKTKMKGKTTEVAGKANVLIFPDLNTGNNTYKAVQQGTGAVAMGPVLQGLRKPVNDLSRGCTVKDIITTVAITALQAYAMKGQH